MTWLIGLLQRKITENFDPYLMFSVLKPCASTKTLQPTDCSSWSTLFKPVRFVVCLLVSCHAQSLLCGDSFPNRVLFRGSLLLNTVLLKQCLPTWSPNTISLVVRSKSYFVDTMTWHCSLQEGLSMLISYHIISRLYVLIFNSWALPGAHSCWGLRSCQTIHASLPSASSWLLICSTWCITSNVSLHIAAIITASAIHWDLEYMARCLVLSHSHSFNIVVCEDRATSPPF